MIKTRIVENVGVKIPEKSKSLKFKINIIIRGAVYFSEFQLPISHSFPIS
jgi:hypothetical protein